MLNTNTEKNFYFNILKHFSVLFVYSFEDKKIFTWSIKVKVMKKIIYKLLVILSSAIILLALLFFTKGLDQLINLLKNINYYWIGAAFGGMLLYWVADALTLQLITRSLFEEQRFLDSFKVTMVGQFFNSITPFATGGQPAQAYVMVKDGVKPGHSITILVVKSIFFQTTLVLYTLAATITKITFFNSSIPHFMFLYLLGLGVNLIVISTYILSFYSREAAEKIVRFIFKILRKLKFLKNIDKTKSKIEAEIVSFDEGVEVLKKNKKVLIKAFILQISQLTFYFIIPYFIYIGLHTGRINGISLWTMIATQSIVTMITFLIPSPGSTGGAEGTGYLFFSLFFKHRVVIPVILIWRIITYYLPVVFGGLVSALAPEKPLKNKG